MLLLQNYFELHSSRNLHSFIHSSRNLHSFIHLSRNHLFLSDWISVNRLFSPSSSFLMSSAFCISSSVLGLLHRLCLSRSASPDCARESPLSSFSRAKVLKYARSLRQVRCMAEEKSNALRWAWGGSRGPVIDKFFRSITEATSSSLGKYVSSPTTFLHSLDPRVKLIWLLALTILPARAHIVMRFGLVVFLAFLSIWVLPEHVWKEQGKRITLLSGFLFLAVGFTSDGTISHLQPRTPPPILLDLPNLPAGQYLYSIMKLGPLHFTRKGLSVASASACLSFSVIQSISLCLATTTPEQLASALQWFIMPLKHIGVGVAEVILTLLLSLRFIGLLSEEAHNIAMGIVSRRIHWEQFGTVETLSICVMYVHQIFKRIFRHADKISQAMIARGFRGDSNTYNLYLCSDLTIKMLDIFALLCLLGIMGGSFLSELLI